MPKRTQIVCLHEGLTGRSIDPVFINRLLKDLDPPWVRPWGSNVIRYVDCGGRKQLIDRAPDELEACLAVGSDTTLVIWADIDDDLPDGDALKKKFWLEAQKAGVTRNEFDRVVFVFAKDRLENWIEFLNSDPNRTDENREGPRVSIGEATKAARKLAHICNNNEDIRLPPSLEWSCKNWRTLTARMKA